LRNENDKICPVVRHSLEATQKRNRTSCNYMDPA
jgi:hypothetical protein